jgi:hypothetical protein
MFQRTLLLGREKVMRAIILNERKKILIGFKAMEATARGTLWGAREAQDRRKIPFGSFVIRDS